MNKPTLYLFIGYPGAGKTTIAKIINDVTGAVHLWADHERRKMFVSPSHAHGESIQLYDHLNAQADKLLANGESVVFDTNFNFYKDREHLRRIARSRKAISKLIWVNTPLEICKKRAVGGIDHNQTRILGRMSEAEFMNIADKLETPNKSEKFIKIDCTNFDRIEILKQLSL